MILDISQGWGPDQTLAEAAMLRDNFHLITFNGRLLMDILTMMRQRIEVAQTRPGLNQSPSPLDPPMLRTSISTGSSEMPAPRAIRAGDNEVVGGGGGGLQPISPSMQDIQVFIGFANFYRRFIRGFNETAAPHTSMLKTTGSSEESAPKAFRADGDEVVGGDGVGRANETVKNSSKSNKSKNPTETAKPRKSNDFTKLSKSRQRSIQTLLR